MGLIDHLSNSSVAFVMYIHVHDNYRANEFIFVAFWCSGFIYLVLICLTNLSFLDADMIWTALYTFLVDKQLMFKKKKISSWKIVREVTSIQINCVVSDIFLTILYFAFCAYLHKCFLTFEWPCSGKSQINRFFFLVFF